LLEVATASGDLFRAPRGLAVPFGVMELALDKAGLQGEYQTLCNRVHDAAGAELDDTLTQLHTLIAGLAAPDAVVAAVAACFGPQTRLAVRSSANGEDLEHLAGAGLYESVVGVVPADVAKAVAQVWSSLWTRRAALSRRQAGIAPERIRMAVLVQELVAPDLSFIMHTVDPLTGDRGEALVELAVGLGETLASANQPGTPARLSCNRRDGTARLTACATFSLALRPPDGRSERLDYSRVALSADPNFARELGRRLAQVATRIEEVFGGPQDVEGVVADGVIHLVQARPQQGL
jgi:phosphoglucan,water dikinase